MRITYWWRAPTSYFAAGTKALVDAGHEVSVVFEDPRGTNWEDAAFADLMTNGYGHLSDHTVWSGQPNLQSLLPRASQPPADVLIVSSWGFPLYVRESTRLPPPTLRLVFVDSPWRASAKQLAGMVTHRRRLGRAFDAAWVAGQPQRRLARNLGFAPDAIFENVNCCDTHLFQGGQSPAERFDAPFLFVGRRVENKGVRQLAEAYGRFRRTTGSTRGLRILGNGPLEVEGEGIEVLPFTDPAGVRTLMDTSFALVHPAFLEHWGIVVHEAAAMGLPLILSPHVHAGTSFLTPGLNGLHGGPEVSDLTRALEHLDGLDLASYRAMSDASRTKAATLTLESWVDHFNENVGRLRPRR